MAAINAVTVRQGMSRDGGVDDVAGYHVTCLCVQ
jgi:hypothetical protein